MDKKLPFKEQPLCEVFENNPAEQFSLLKSGWQYICSCTDKSKRYSINLHHFFSSPSESINWLAHFDIKVWMDWKDFMSMMRRFREEAFGWNQEGDNNA